MYNTYTSSVLWSLRTKGSVPFLCNDYFSLLNERFDRGELVSSSSQKCCACSCCCSYKSLATNRVPINLSFLYGLRQSTLIQWKPFRRRLTLRGGDRFLCRFPVYDLEDDSFSHSWNIRERYVSKNVERRRGRFRCLASDESSEPCGIDEAEAVISLLSEEYLCQGERKQASFHGVEREKRRYNNEPPRGNKKRDEVKRRENYGCGSHSGKKNELGSGLSASDSRRECESYTIKSNGRRHGEREVDSIGQPRKGRTKSSSCSSYYSVSSGQLESELEDRDKDTGFVKESLNCRRRQENKSRASSRYHKQYNDEEEKSNLAVNMDQRRRKQFRSRQSYEEDTDIHEIHVDEDVDATSQLQECSSGREEGATVSVEGTSDRVYIRKRMHEKSDIRLAGAERISQMQRHSGSRQKIREEDINVIQSPVQGIREEQRQTEGRMLEQSDRRRRTDRLSNSVIRDTDTRRVSNLQSEIRTKDQEECSGFHSGSSKQLKKQSQYRVQSPVQRVPSRRGSADTNSESVSYSSDVVRVTESRRTSENRINKQENILSSVERPLSETKNGHMPSQTDKRAVQKDLSTGTQEVYGLYKSHDKISEQGSSSQVSLTFSSRNTIQLADVGEEITNSREILTPPLFQLVRRGSRPHETTAGVNNEGVSYEISGSSYDAVYTKPHNATLDLSNQSYGGDRRNESPGEPLSFPMHEDALGSAQRSEQLSMQLIGEFIENASHGVSALETQKKQGAPDAKLASEVEKSTVQYSSEKSQLKRRESRQSSEGSGAKGPSDETWVTDPAAQQTPEADAPDSGSATVNAVVKRTERSLWGVIGDVFRLRWASRGGASGTAAKSGGKSSSGESVSNETWFSGREHDESSDDNFKKEKRMTYLEAANSNQQRVGQTTTQGESSGPMRLKGKLGQHETELLSFSSRLDGSSSATRLLTPMSSDEIVGTNESGRTFHGRVSETDLVEPSFQLRAQSLRRSPIVRENSETNPTEISSSGYVVEQAEQPPIETDLVEPSSQLQARSLRRSSIVREISETNPTNMSGSRCLVEQAEQPQIGISSENLGSVSKDGVPKQRKVHRLNENKSSCHGPVSETDVVEPSSQLRVRSLRKSPVVRESSEANPSDMPSSGPLVGQPQLGRSLEESGTPSKDGFPKEKKLQRTNQVLRDRFDEWEEAYQREAEQRRMDEIFMREALLEAKKAADLWEVPVGAVLVHDGKIIARGCNLVEELRDSTAHAEMICIREASNLLRSWRLAETTLYVTLEPCPMCAGAILQARIKTLVWGAPNKLLGADGSWIRLFPDGEGSGSELSDKPPAPVHPFHPKMTIHRGVLASECADTMQQFFQLRRKKKAKDVEPPTPPLDANVSHHPSKILAKMHDIFHVMFCL